MANLCNLNLKIDNIHVDKKEDRYSIYIHVYK